MELLSRLSSYTVITFALVVTIVGGIWSFLVERYIAIDQFGLFNPIYMVWKYGIISYPAYGEFQTLAIHPPTNYILIGEFMRLGLSAPFAEAVGPFALILLCVTMIIWSKFSSQTKLCLLFGLIGGSLIPWAVWTDGYGGIANVRPDLMVAFAFFGGLVALESGRLDGWNTPRLCLGGALLTLASTLHYIALAACSGILFYAGWVLIRNKIAGLRPAGSILLGSLLVAIPFALLWAIPQLHEIAAQTLSARPFGGIYANVVSEISFTSFIYGSISYNAVSALLFFPLEWGIPMVLLSTPILLWNRETRGIALGSLPQSLFLLLIVQRKTEGTYYVPELMIYATAVAIFIFACINPLGKWVDSRFKTSQNAVNTVTIIIGIMLLVSVVSVTLNPAYTGSLSTSRPDELSIARAAGREILGPHALVGVNLARNYIFGEAYSYMITPTLLWNPFGNLNLTRYFSNFDSIEADNFESNVASNGINETVPSWYVGGILNLRGFYFSTLHSPTLDYLLLGAKKPSQVQGYATLGNWTVTRFEQAASGNYVYVAALCQGGNVLPELPTLFSNTYLLPAHGSGAAPELVTFISTKSNYASHAAEVTAQCTIHQEINLDKQNMPFEQLLGVLKDDPPILFFPNLQGALIARQENMSVYSSAEFSGGRFDDNFSSDILGKAPTSLQAYVGTGTSIRVDNCPSLGTKKCVGIVVMNGTGYAQLSTPLQGVETSSFEFHVLAGQNNRSLNIYGITTGFGIGAQIAFLYDGTISYYDGFLWHKVSNYQAGKWYDVTMTDFASGGSYSIYLNGTLAVQGARMRTPGSIQNLEFQTYSEPGGSWYISSVTVSYLIPGPAIGEGPPIPYVVLTAVLEEFVITMIALQLRPYASRMSKQG